MSALEKILARITRSLDSDPGADSALGVSASFLGPDSPYAAVPDAVSSYLRVDQGYLEAIADADAMDQYPLLTAAIDILADDATQADSQTGRTVWVQAKSKKFERILDEMVKSLELDARVWADTRLLAKYGNLFVEPVLTAAGVSRLHRLPAYTMRRVEDERSNLRGFVQDFGSRMAWTIRDYEQAVKDYERWNRSPEASRQSPGSVNSVPAIPFEWWRVVHMRLTGKNPDSPYGSSIFESARWVWRRLMLLDDAVLRFRLDRAPERYAYYINVGQKTDAEAMAYVQQFRRQVRKRRYMDSSGKLNVRYDPIGQDEDVFIPIRAGDETRVETLASPVWQCLVGDTRIPLLDGSAPTIRELTERGGSFWVYSVDEGGNVVPGRGHSARVTHEAAEVWEVELDSGEVVSCTGNHPFLTRAGRWVRAEDLTPGEPLMPLYRRTSSKVRGDYLHGYEQVYHPATGRYEYTHHAVYRATAEPPEAAWRRGQVIHHKNHRKLDNTPGNLAAYSYAELVAEVVASGARTQKEFRRASGRSTNLLKRVLQEVGVSWAEMAREHVAGWVPRGRGAARDRPGYLNHTVVAVRRTGRVESVYDITVDEHHNFAVAQGVVVHNSTDDAEFFRTLLYAAMKTPRAYLGDETGVVRATLSSQDVRFARTVLRAQRPIRSGYEELGRLHLAARGVDPTSVDFAIRMTAPSAVFELAQLEVRNARADLASRMREHCDMTYVLSKVLLVPEDEIKGILDRRVEDLQREGGMGGPGMPGGGDGMPPEDAAPDVPIGPYGDQGDEGGAQPEWRRAVRLAVLQEQRRRSRADERLWDKRLEEILAGDAKMAAQLAELRLLLHEVRATARAAAASPSRPVSTRRPERS